MGLHKGVTPTNINLLIEKGKNSRFKKGDISWNRGIITSDEIRKKISKSKIGTISHKKGNKYIYKNRTYKICPTCKKEFTDFPYRMKVKRYCNTTCANRNVTPAKLIQREKFKKTMIPIKGIILSDTHKKNISLAKQKTWMNPEYRVKKLKQMENNWKENTLFRSGKNSPRWLGGISFEEYGVDFNNTLKNNIRQRDNHTCQICMKQSLNIDFPVHHIDYNKKNNNPSNLLTLCFSCHPKTNFNRNMWKMFLIGIIFQKYKELKIENSIIPSISMFNKESLEEAS